MINTIFLMNLAFTRAVVGFPSPISNTPGEKACPRCGEVQPIEEFAGDRSKASGLRSFCKSCDRAKSKRYYAENREKRLAVANARNRARREAAK